MLHWGSKNGLSFLTFAQRPFGIDLSLFFLFSFPSWQRNPPNLDLKPVHLSTHSVTFNSWLFLRLTQDVWRVQWTEFRHICQSHTVSCEWYDTQRSLPFNHGHVFKPCSKTTIIHTHAKKTGLKRAEDLSWFIYCICKVKGLVHFQIKISW